MLEAVTARESAVGLGALKFIDPAKVVRAAKLVRTGQVISLNLPLDWPPPGVRTALERSIISHHVLRPMADGRYAIVNDDAVQFSLQGSSHWDALGHFGVLSDDSPAVYYGGVGIEETLPDPSPARLGIDAIAGGIVTRGVLLDMVSYLAGPEAKWLESDVRITGSVIEDYLRDHGLSLERGDAVLVRTGFPAQFQARGGRYSQEGAGLDGSTVAALVEAEISALVADNMAVEYMPVDYAVHAGALRDAGIYMGELWDLDELARACREDDIYEFLLTSAPLNIPGAFGSPANALAIR